MSIVVTLRQASDLEKGAQAGFVRLVIIHFLIWVLVIWVCSPCENLSSRTLKIMHFYVYYTSIKIKLEKYVLHSEKRMYFQKGGESNASSVTVSLRVLIYWVLYCVPGELNILFLDYFI